jgi:hypothetical protein
MGVERVLRKRSAVVRTTVSVEERDSFECLDRDRRLLNPVAFCYGDEVLKVFEV